MPVPPSNWLGSAPTTSHQLNQDMYSYDGSGFGANGINFHANRPILLTCAWKARANLGQSTTGQHNNISGTAGGTTTTAYNVIDTAALFGLGSDNPGSFANYTFTAQATSGSGSLGIAGGYYLNWHFPSGRPIQSGPGAVGADQYFGTTLTVSGVYQRAFTSHDNIPFFLDLTSAGSTSTAFSAGVLFASQTGVANFLDLANGGSQGLTSRMGWIWEGVIFGGNTLPALPAPATSYTSASTVSSSTLNSTNGVKGVMNFLNNPPMFRAFQQLTTAIPNLTATTVPFTAHAVSVDNYTKFNTSTHVYTVPINGLYLVHGLVAYAETTGSTGRRLCGLNVNGTLYQGPAYAPMNTGGDGSVAITRILDLQAGDTVALYALQNQGASLNLSGTYGTRLVIAWLAGTGNTGLTWTPPDSTFRWTAGTPGGQLPAQWQSHMANDLNFLIYKPYFIGIQTVAQTGFANNSGFHAVTIDSVGGQIHSTNGDPYNGWSAANNWYVAQQPGWYLVLGEVYVTLPTTTTGYVAAGLNCPTSGGYTPTIAFSYPPDWYQQVFNNLTTGSAPGATAIGLYYLLAGEHVQLQVQTQDWTATTWGTTAASPTTTSYLSCVWVCN